MFALGVLQPLAPHVSKPKSVPQTQIHSVQLTVLPQWESIEIKMGKSMKALSEDVLTVQVGKHRHRPRKCAVTVRLSFLPTTMKLLK